MTLRIKNRDARRLWLHSQHLLTEPAAKLSPAGLSDLIKGLGFVQLDTIRVVARAHDHILWSRNPTYREPMLEKALAEHRHVFEHFTHDASVIPTDFYPYWGRQFRRMGKQTSTGGWGKALPPKRERDKILKRIEDEGPLCTRDFDTKKKSNRVWARPPHKYALDHMWYAGLLATSHRENFTKFYDLADRVIPGHLRAESVSDAKQLDWLCHQAIDRLGFATEGALQRFWDAADSKEVKTWVAKQKHLVPVEIETAEGTWDRAFAHPDIEQRLEVLPSPSSRLRIVSPFDPVIRDRARLAKLFGFDYRIEIFVPAAKRQYGYYVYPLLEGDRMVGRIEVTSDRKAGTLTVENLWSEHGVRASKARTKRLNAELARLAGLVGAKEVHWTCVKPE